MNAPAKPKLRPIVRPNFIAAVPVLPSPDVDASLAWYGEMLGFETWRWDEPATYGAIRREGIELHFFECGDPAVCEAAQARIHLRAITPLYRQARTAGVLHGSSGLVEMPWGYLEFSVRDPFGVRLTFGQDLDRLNPPGP